MVAKAEWPGSLRDTFWNVYLMCASAKKLNPYLDTQCKLLCRTASDLILKCKQVTL